MADIFETADRFRAELLRRERQAASELVRAYGAVWQRIRQRLDDLGEQIAQARQRGEDVSPAWLLQFERLQTLQRQVEAEINQFARYAEPVIVAGQAQAVELGQQHAEQLMLAGLGEPPPGVTITFARLPSEALRDLIGFLQDGSPLRDLLDELGPEASRQVRQALIAGVATGQHPTQIARQVRQALGGNLVRALTIARTEVLRAYRESSRRVYEANRDVVEGWVWHSAANARTCAFCVPAGTLVSGPRPEKAFSRYYSGDIVVIETAGGKQLAITPNHPVLTTNGWVSAGSLHEGCDVVCSAFSEGAVFSIDVDNDYVPTPIEEIPKAFGMVPTEVECSPPDFHGDGVGSEIYVVWANRLLGDDGDSTCKQHLLQSNLGAGSVHLLSLCRPFLPTLGSFDTLVPRAQVGARMVLEDHLAGAQRRSRGTDLLCFLQCAYGDTRAFEYRHHGVSSKPQTSCDLIERLAGQIARYDLLGERRCLGAECLLPVFAGALVPRCFVSEQAPLFEDGSESLAANAESGRNLLRRLAGKVRTDRVLKVFRRGFRGHVFNLQTAPGWYAANGIIVHNCWSMHGTVHSLDEHFASHPRCRCSPVPLTKSWAELGFRNVTETRVEVTPGPELFARLPEEQQRAILGPAKFAAYRAGQITLEDLRGFRRDARWGRVGYERSLAEIVGPEAARRWLERGVTQRELPPIAGGAESPRERIERLIREGKMTREAVDRAEYLWHERWQRGIQMPNGEVVSISLDDLYHLLVDNRIWRKPERIERILHGVYELRATREGRRRALSRWDEEGQSLVGYAIISGDSHAWTMHIIAERDLRKYRDEELLWSQ
ncbi:MAG: hypothetical protein IRY83_04050 [Chloroflexi bacterium]|nr:hypothetical protein [Chloroflexota bacterium]